MTETYDRLSTKGFYSAVYVSEREDNAPVRFRAARLFGTDKPKVVLPLREYNYGAIRPHIYAKQIAQNTAAIRGSKQREPSYNLARAHIFVNSLFEMNGRCDSDYATQGADSLIRQLKEWGETGDKRAAELLEKVQLNTEDYYDIREARNQQVAAALTRSIRGKELYLVGHNETDEIVGSEEFPSYAVSLVGMASVREGSRMFIEPLVRDSLGAVGLLDTGFFVPAGISAPKA